MTVAPNAPLSLVMARVGGENYPMRSEANCKTCQSPNRLHIESELVRGRSYRTIARSLVGMPEGVKGHPSHESIANHVKGGHVPLGQAAQRRIIERRAVEIGRAVEDSEDPLTDYVTLNQMIVNKGVEMMASGDLDIKATDVIAASKFLYGVEQGAGGEVDVQAWIEAVTEFMEIAQKHIPPSAWQAYAAELHASPVLKALAQKQSKTVSGEMAD